MEELDRQLKGVLLRIAVSETLLEGPVLGEDATFEVKVHALQSAVSELEGTTQFHVCMYLHMHCIYACVLHIHTGMVYTPFMRTHTHTRVCVHTCGQSWQVANLQMYPVVSYVPTKNCKRRKDNQHIQP